MSFSESAMASCMSTTMGVGASSTPWPTAEGLLEATIPGFSVFSRFAKTYLQLDLSALISIILPFAALFAAVRYVYGPLSNYILKYGVCTAEIKNDDEMYNYIMYWIAQQNFAARTRTFLATTKVSSDIVYDYDEGDSDVKDDDVNDWELANDNFDLYWAKITARDRIKNVYFTPCDGTHYFQYKGHWLTFSRATVESNLGRFGDKRETLHVSCLGRDASIIKDLLKEAQNMYIQRDGTKTVIYRKDGLSDDWSRCMARPPRPLSTVVLDPKLKKALVDDLKEYLHPLTKRWYANRGIPYRRGYLLHGPPGTGKTSLCVAIAGMFGMKVYVTSLNSRTLTEDGLATLFGYLPERCVVLLEDVDSAGVTHKRAPDLIEPTKADQALQAATGNPNPTAAADTRPTGISLSGLLNVIDGVASSEGRILIMTTNHIEKLDPALLRPGRVDMSIAFENASTATAKELFRTTYTSREEDYPPIIGEHKENRKTMPRKFDFSDDEIEELATQFAVQLPSGEFSPADIQGYLLKHKATPKEAANGVPSWIGKIREEKERQRKPDGGSSRQSDTPVLV